MLVDSHCHLDMLDLSLFDNNMDNVIQAAKDMDVNEMLCVSVNLQDFPNMLSITEKYDNVNASVGVHPNETFDDPAGEPTVNELVKLANHPKVLAIGETGLDYYRSTDDDMSWQQNRFRVHMEAARQTNKPLIIHTRMAREDTISIMQEENAQDIGGVMHCFTESWDMAKAAMDLGFFISFSGIVTFKNAAELQETAQKTPLEYMLVETDCPYLAPLPHRGKPNQPAYVRHTAEFLAELKGVSLEELARVTTENYYRFLKKTVESK